MAETATSGLATEEAIIAECAASERLWEDPHFSPPVDEVWRRPADIYGAEAVSVFSPDGLPSSGVSLVPGAIGDGWLVGALATLAARHPAQLQRLFVPTKHRKSTRKVALNVENNAGQSRGHL